MTPRAEGTESEVVRRLTDGIEPAGVRDVLVRCLGGELPSSEALLALLADGRSPADVRAAIDEVTRRADEDSRASDSMVRDRVDDLTQLVVDSEDGADRVADHRVTSPTPPTGMPAMGGAPEPLWSRPDGEAQERAIAGLLDAFARWGLLGSTTTALQIGCGGGRVEAQIAARVREAHGIERDPRLAAAARRRTAALDNVFVDEWGGRDLSAYDAGTFDLVYAIDCFPSLEHPDEAAALVLESARVLRPGGALAIANWSYHDDPADDAAQLSALATRAGLRLAHEGEMVEGMRLWVLGKSD